MKQKKIIPHKFIMKSLSFLVFICGLITGCMSVDGECPSVIKVNNYTGHNCAFYANNIFMDSIKDNFSKKIELTQEKYNKNYVFEMIYQEEFDSVPTIYSKKMTIVPCSGNEWSVVN